MVSVGLDVTVDEQNRRLLRTVQFAHLLFLISYLIYCVVASIIIPALKPSEFPQGLLYGAVLVVLLMIFFGKRIRESITRSVTKRKGRAGARGGFFIGRVLELILYEISATAGLLIALVAHDPIWSFLISGFACLVTALRFPRSIV